MDRVGDFYSRLLEGPTQRQILAEAFRTVNIPEPAKRFLKLIGKMEEEDVNYADMLPQGEALDEPLSSGSDSEPGS